MSSVNLATVGAGLSREERETIIRTSAADDTWEVYTCDPVMARRLQKLCELMGISLVPVGSWGVRATLPRSCVRLHKPMAISDEERQRRADALRARLAQREQVA